MEVIETTRAHNLRKTEMRWHGSDLFLIAHTKNKVDDDDDDDDNDGTAVMMTRTMRALIKVMMMMMMMMMSPLTLTFV